MTPRGSELSRFSSGNTRFSESGGSKSGNIRADSDAEPPPASPCHHVTTSPKPPAPTPPDPELAAVVAAWPALPPAIRAGVMALVRAGGGT
ncbi:MAG: hypothetical protein JNK25_11670 [Phycisphaerae bacterium]|nr:hypothetical protein [Phycisphaerae bacterium]